MKIQPVKSTNEDQVQVVPSSAPQAGDGTHPMRARRDGQRADRAPREKRDFGDRKPREDRAPREDRTPREDRATRNQQRDEERARMASDPVYASLASSASSEKQLPPHLHASGLNRKQRRDLARAEGKIAPVTHEAPIREAPIREVGEAPPRRSERPHADTRAAERRERPDSRRPEGFKPRGSKPDGFKPRGPKPEGFAPRGPKPEGFKSRGPKPDGFKPRGPKADGKPFRKFGDKPGGKPGGKPFRGKRDSRG